MRPVLPGCSIVALFGTETLDNILFSVNLRTSPRHLVPVVVLYPRPLSFWWLYVRLSVYAREGYHIPHTGIPFSRAEVMFRCAEVMSRVSPT